ncbi:MAG TPA: M48 family metallopeptidase [Steroidobacteraceae bacterium]
MRPALRLALLAVLVGCGIALVLVLQQQRARAPLATTWTSAFQVLGTPLKLADRAASRVLPIGEVDEAALGDVYLASFDSRYDGASREQRYVDSLLEELRPYAGKSFDYRAYVVDYPSPNAMALPGGVILVTRDLLTTLHSESELFAVLAHELGHIERGHCFDTVRFELLTRKVGAEPIGELADMAAGLLLRHSFSKTMEHEADAYAYELLTHSRYDPRGVGLSFRSLQQYETRLGAAQAHASGPLRDYFTSHPPLAIRAAEYTARADAWWTQHPAERRYVGRRNLAALVALDRHELRDEWTGAEPGPGAGQ